MCIISPMSLIYSDVHQDMNPGNQVLAFIDLTVSRTCFQNKNNINNQHFYLNILNLLYVKCYFL